MLGKVFLGIVMLGKRLEDMFNRIVLSTRRLDLLKTKRPFHKVLHLFWTRKLKQGQHVFWLFFKMDPCSAISIESFRRDLLNGLAEL